MPEGQAVHDDEVGGGRDPPGLDDHRFPATRLQGTENDLVVHVSTGDAVKASGNDERDDPLACHPLIIPCRSETRA
jgi:hypothetical protein